MSIPASPLNKQCIRFLGSLFLGFLILFIVQSSGSFTYTYNSDLIDQDRRFNLDVQQIIYSPPLGKEILTTGKNKNFREEDKHIFALTPIERTGYYIESFKDKDILYLGFIVSALILTSMILFEKRDIFRKSK